MTLLADSIVGVTNPMTLRPATMAFVLAEMPEHNLRRRRGLKAIPIAAATAPQERDFFGPPIQSP